MIIFANIAKLLNTHNSWAIFQTHESGPANCQAAIDYISKYYAITLRPRQARACCGTHSARLRRPQASQEAC